MESASLGLIFGCAGAMAAFYGTKCYLRQKYGMERNDADGSDADAEISKAYDRLFLLRMGCLVLSLAAACTWFLEPHPYAAGVLGAGACWLLWKAFRQRSWIVKKSREVEDRIIGGMASPGPESRR
ncbi:MAG: hypothetical protein IKS68_03520 [Mailhella sp.]|nr:hypothetical protein [Mailhella sp.]